jgi:hypothetical protein
VPDLFERDFRNGECLFAGPCRRAALIVVIDVKI